jgi:hypothetical protein
VLPENLGSIAPNQWHSYKSRLPEDLMRAARTNLVVRDDFGAFYFHPFLRLAYLKRTVEGIEAVGYTLVDPASLKLPSTAFEESNHGSFWVGVSKTLWSGNLRDFNYSHFKKLRHVSVVRVPRERGAGMSAARTGGLGTVAVASRFIRGT